MEKSIFGNDNSFFKSNILTERGLLKSVGPLISLKNQSGKAIGKYYNGKNYIYVYSLEEYQKHKQQEKESKSEYLERKRELHGRLASLGQTSKKEKKHRRRYNTYNPNKVAKKKTNYGDQKLPGLE